MAYFFAKYLYFLFALLTLTAFPIFTYELVFAACLQRHEYAGKLVLSNALPIFNHLKIFIMENEHQEAKAAGVEVTAKEFLRFDETARYMGVSRSYLYKLTMWRRIPHYKPNGKMIYFNRKEVDMWLGQNRVATADELEARAQSYCAKKKGGAL